MWNYNSIFRQSLQNAAFSVAALAARQPDLCKWVKGSIFQTDNWASFTAHILVEFSSSILDYLKILGQQQDMFCCNYF